jgi:SHAQKYF class myb-like DNA-binding protein
MTITARVQQQFFAEPSTARVSLIRLPPTVVTNYATKASQQISARRAARSRRRTNLWTVEEHDRFLRGLEQFPRGPWKEIAAIVGSKTTRQTMTHAQKYRQKIERRQRSNAPVETLPNCPEKHVPSFQEVLPGNDSECYISDLTKSSDDWGDESFSRLVLEATSPIEVDVDFFASTQLYPDFCSSTDAFTMSYTV